MDEANLLKAELQAAPADRTEPLSIASIVIGAGSVLLPLIAGGAAVVLGHLSLARIKREGTRGKALAIAGIVLGWLNVLIAVSSVVVFISVLSAQPSPGEQLNASVKSDVRNTVSNIVAAEASDQQNAQLVVSDRATRMVVIIGDEVTVASGKPSGEGAVPASGQDFVVCAYNANSQNYRQPDVSYGYNSRTGMFETISNCG